MKCFNGLHKYTYDREDKVISHRFLNSFFVLPVYHDSGKQERIELNQK